MFKKNIPVDCEYCSHGYILEKREHCVCNKCGVVMRRFKCKHFNYDPLLRQPMKRQLPEPLSNNDFI